MADRYGLSSIGRAREYRQLDNGTRTSLSETFSRIMLVLLVEEQLVLLGQGDLAPRTPRADALLHGLGNGFLLLLAGLTVVLRPSLTFSIMGLMLGLEGLPDPITHQDMPCLLHLLLMTTDKQCQDYAANSLQRLMAILAQDDPLRTQLLEYRTCDGVGNLLLRRRWFAYSVLLSAQVNFFHAAAFAGDIELLTALAHWGICKTNTCAKRMTALHFAAIGGSEAACRRLLEWGHKLHTLDNSKKSPLDYCQDENLCRSLALMGQMKDIFISYGHQADVTKFAEKLVHDLEVMGLSTWIDHLHIEG